MQQQAVRFPSIQPFPQVFPVFSIKNIQFSEFLFLDRVFRLTVIKFSL